jgi:hypothetical protein
MWVTVLNFTNGQVESLEYKPEEVEDMDEYLLSLNFPINSINYMCTNSLKHIIKGLECDE